jgi:hypothetical protein
MTRTASSKIKFRSVLGGLFGSINAASSVYLKIRRMSLL